MTENQAAFKAEIGSALDLVIGAMIKHGIDRFTVDVTEGDCGRDDCESCAADRAKPTADILEFKKK